MNLSEALTGAVVDFSCRLWTNTQAPGNAIAAAGSNIPGVSGVSEILTGANNAFGSLVCEDGGGNQSAVPADNFPPAPVPPAGQCSFNYIVGVDFAPGGIPGTGGADQEAPGQFAGPITNFRRATSSNGQQWEWFADSPQQSDIFLGAVFKSAEPDPTGQLTARRPGGLPDECPEQETPEPEQPSTTVPIDYDDEFGNPVNIDIDINAQAPVLNVNGTLIQPFLVIAPTFSLSANLNVLTGDVNLSIGVGNPGDSNCCPPAQDIPQDIPQDSDDPDPPKSDLRFVGLYYKMTGSDTSGRVTTIGDGIGPDLLVPRGGVVSFAVQLGGRNMWLNDIPLKKRSGYIAVPDGLTAYDYKFFMEPGISVEVSEVTVAIAED